MGIPVYHPGAWERGVSINFNSTLYASLFNSNVALTATEGDRQLIVRPAGRFGTSGFYVSANTIATSATVFTLRVNGAPSGLTVTVAANATGWQPSVGSATIAAGDKVCWQIVTPNTSGSLTVTNSYFEFAATGTSSQIWAPPTVAAANGVTRYATFMGAQGNTATAGHVCNAAGILQSLSVFYNSNGRAVVDAFTVMQNGLTSSLTKSSSASTSGPYEDLAHPLTVTAGDTFDLQSVWGASATGSTVSQCACFELNGTAYPLFQTWAQAIATNTTNYAQLAGSARGYTAANEAQAQTLMSHAGTISKAWIVPGSNGITANSTLSLRVNGVNTAITFLIGSGSTAPQTDSTNVVTVKAGDLVDWELVTGGTGTTISITRASVLFTPRALSVPRSRLGAAVQRAASW
jgi:hypothetical protein